MKMNRLKTITETNLSIAWAKAFLHVLENEGDGCLVLRIQDFSAEIPAENLEISGMLNDLLRSNGTPTIAQTALTIVPYDRWNRMGRPKLETLKKWYLAEYLPRLKARCTKNRHGTYFERLVSYTGIKYTNHAPKFREVDQLQHIIDLWQKGNLNGKRPRQSALQLACFDPSKDHTGSALAGFPCLQQVSLTYKEFGSIELNAYYPTQYLFERAYGNYLGLCQLGHFIAHHLGVRFAAFNCFVPNPELGDINKSQVSQFASHLRDIIGRTDLTNAK